MATNEEQAKEVFLQIFPLAKTKIEVHAFSLAYQAGKIAFRVRDEEGHLIKIFPDMIEAYVDFGTKKQRQFLALHASAANAIGKMYQNEEFFNG